MLFRWKWRGMLLFICLAFSGCYQGGEGQVDELKNPYFLNGRDRVAERDYKGAIEAFEKALEANPHSAQAHFELGVLYEQHSDQKEEDYVSAMFHYNQAIKLRPNDYPADNARQRVTYCKRELVKAESLAPVAQNLMRELDRLKEENRLLHKQLESAQLPAPSRAIVQTKTPANHSETTGMTSPLPAPPTNGQISANRTPASVSSRERITPLPPVPTAARTHTVKAGETLYSISRQYHVKLDALLSANPTADSKRIKVGQVLAIPAT